MKHNQVVYYEEVGKVNLDNTLSIAAKAATERDIRSLVVFTGDGDAAVTLKGMVDTSISVIAVSFPYKQKFIVKGETEEEKEFEPPTSSEVVRHRLAGIGIPLILAPLPFQPIIIPGAKDDRIEGIIRALEMVSPSLPLCVQGITVATDAGYIEPGSDVISLSADTAIVASACPTRWMFHPDEGMRIKEFLCKPKAWRLGSF